MQNYNRIYDYFVDYWKTLYEYYANHAVAYVVTYYSLDQPNTVWDNENLMGGYYEKIGALSGVRWKKILLFPVYFITEIDTIFDAQEGGLLTQGELDFVFPATYGINPVANDILKLYQNYIQEDDRYALYVVTGTQKQTSGDKTYYKCRARVEQSRTIDDIEPQVSSQLVYYDYDKKIHLVDEAATMTRLLSKNSAIRTNLNNLFDQNSGLYFV
jgi:hypothetical protein